MNNVGTNTLDVVVEPNRNRLRTSTMEANAQTSIPIVDITLPSGGGSFNNTPVNLSISGYEPDSLRNSHMRSPSMRAQEISIMPQLDGPASLPMRDPIEKKNTGNSQVSRMRILSRRHICTEGLLHQEGENIQEEMVMMIIIEGHIEIEDPLREGDIQIKVGDPLTEEGTLIEDLLEEDIPIEMEDPWKRRIPRRRTP